jgi:hypothetical protein
VHLVLGETEVSGADIYLGGLMRKRLGLAKIFLLQFFSLVYRFARPRKIEKITTYVRKKAGFERYNK